MERSHMHADTTRPGFSRREFLMKAAIGAAAAVGAGTFIQRRLLKSGALQASPVIFDEDSIFKPRADALKRMLTRR